MTSVRGSRSAALVVLALLYGAGCSSSPAEPQTFAMDGVVTVAPRFVAPVGNLNCESIGMTPNVSAGVPVTIRDGAGVIVGTDQLLPGALQTDGTCKFRFTPSIPAGADFYSVQVGNSDPITIDREAAQRTVALSFGT